MSKTFSPINSKAKNPNSETSGINFVRWSVDHPYVVLAFFIGMLFLGYLAVTSFMPKRFMPFVESPILGIVTESPGLSPKEMETYFSSPIEERMVSIPNVRYIRSVSQDGFSMVTLEFPYGSDMQKAKSDVQSLLNVVQGDLPSPGASLKPSWVVTVDPLNLPVLSLSLTGDLDKGWTMPRLRELADNELINRFKVSNPNIYTVSTFGGYRRQMQIVVDRNKLKAYNLSILDVKDTLDRYNVARPAGILTGSNEESILRVSAIAKNADEVGNYPVRAVGNQIVKIHDIAKVEDTVVEKRSAYEHLHGTNVDDAIVVNVLQNPNASSPVTIASVLKTSKQLESEFPGIHFSVAYNNAGFVDILFSNMEHELLVAVVLTGICVLLFLGDGRGTLIALTAIPVSLAMSLLAMAGFGMSLNSSTLVGLLIAIGRLVDDAIIDIHAVERHLRMGKSRRDATIDGISEVRRSVLAATIVLIIALVPLMVSGGLTQLMFIGLGLPIVFGLIFSFVVSMTLTAVLCSRFLTVPKERKRTWLRRKILTPFDQKLTSMEKGYERLIRWLLEHRFANFVRIGITVIIGFTLYYFIGSEMMPLADVGQASLQMEMNPGTPFVKTEAATKQLDQIIIDEGARQGWIKNASIELGVESGPGMTTGGAYYTGYQMNQVNDVSAMLTLADKDTGRPNVWTIADRIYRRAMKEIPGIRRIQIKEMGADVMASSQAPVSLVIFGKSLNLLDKIGHQVLEIAQKDALNPNTGKPDIAQPFLSSEMTDPTYKVVVDNDKAAAHGLDPVSISDQAYTALRGGFPMEFFREPNERPMTMLVRFQKDQRENIADLDGMFVTGKDGAQVPLNELVQFKKQLGPSSIEHDQLRRVVTFNGYYRKDGRPSMDVMMDVQMRALAKINWPAGYGIEPRGDMTQMLGSFRVMLSGLAIALVLMYFILVAQFGGFLQPLQMMLSLPLELSGVFFMLWLCHQAFSTVSILGVIVLSGMDIVTAILMIDLILQYRQTGVPRNEAVATASPQRLRPILMTSIITIIVMAQIAFAPKSGLDAYQPLGTVIIGGLVVGTVLSLLDIPIMHTVVDDISRWVQIHLFKVNPADLPPIHALPLDSDPAQTSGEILS